MSNREQIDLFMKPKSIAIIGASRSTGDGNYNILENMLQLGFPCRLYPVNPSTDEILGVKTYQSVRDIPGDVDLAVISTAREQVPGIVRDCVERGIMALVVVGQGFTDGNDDEGKNLQREIVKIAREAGARIMGPNTIGVADAFSNFNTSYMPLEMEKVPIGVISQTGYFFAGLSHLRLIGKGIDLGNACDIDVADGLEYFEDDPDVKVIALYIEGIRDGARFLKVASRVARKKPIVALKTGRSEKGARAVQSHTGSLVGSDRVYEAAFKQCGVVRARDLDEMEDLLMAFLHLPLMNGSRVGIVSPTGAGGIIAVDACERYGLEVANISPNCVSKVEELSPPWMSIGNPMDIWPASKISGHSFIQVYRTALESVLSDDNVDGVLCNVPFRVEEGLLDVISEIAAVSSNKPIVCYLYWFCEWAGLDEVENTIIFPSQDRAIRALAALRNRAEFLKKAQ